MTNLKSPLHLKTKDSISKMEPFIGLDLQKIHLVLTPLDAQSALDNLLCNPVLGFDTESRPTFRKGEISKGPHVLQFATQNSAYIFQTYHAHCGLAIAEILQSKQIAKVGFGLNDDIKRIEGKFGIQLQSIIDLDHTFRRTIGMKNSVGVKTAIAILFNRRFIKSQKSTTSNWSNRFLSEKQLLYAANDAFAALAVYGALKKRGIVVN